MGRSKTKCRVVICRVYTWGQITGSGSRGHWVWEVDPQDGPSFHTGKSRNAMQAKHAAEAEALRLYPEYEVRFK